MRTITEDTIEEVYYSLKHEFYNKGATIINLNKTTDRIYMIVEGTVEIKVGDLRLI
jgi:signal-transduction protein with cAMP-binding, CBS, and nucleotidyltransferase domain